MKILYIREITGNFRVRHRKYRNFKCFSKCCLAEKRCQHICSHTCAFTHVTEMNLLVTSDNNMTLNLSYVKLLLISEDGYVIFMDILRTFHLLAKTWEILFSPSRVNHLSHPIVRCVYILSSAGFCCLCQ